MNLNVASLGAHVPSVYLMPHPVIVGQHIRKPCDPTASGFLPEHPHRLLLLLKGVEELCKAHNCLMPLILVTQHKWGVVYIIEGEASEENEQGY